MTTPARLHPYINATVTTPQGKGVLQGRIVTDGEITHYLVSIPKEKITANLRDEYTVYHAGGKCANVEYPVTLFAVETGEQ